ncbi:iron ABC transporter substrate-binding protein [Natronospora cellulosivora (SeqCode)]
MNNLKNKILLIATVFAIFAVFTFSVLAGQDEITIYSGRSENLIGPVFEMFTEETGIQLNVRYGDTAELAAAILEEGQNTPADIYFAQDAGALGALDANNRLQTIDNKFLKRVDSRFRADNGSWLGISGRARVVAYNTNYVSEDELPDTIWGFLAPEWRARIGWAPTNGSFQAFVTALRVLEGEEGAAEWLRGIIANQPRQYRNNTTTVDAVGRGEVHVGFVNHYYLFRFMAEQGEDFPVRHLYTTSDAGSMINIAGIGVLDVSEKDDTVAEFIDFLLREEVQQHFLDGNAEYPTILGMEADRPHLLPLEEIETPDIDLNTIEDLEGTLELLFDVGAL